MLACCADRCCADATGSSCLDRSRQRRTQERCWLYCPGLICSIDAAITSQSLGTSWSPTLRMRRMPTTRNNFWIGEKLVSVVDMPFHAAAYERQPDAEPSPLWLKLLPWKYLPSLVVLTTCTTFPCKSKEKGIRTTATVSHGFADKFNCRSLSCGEKNTNALVENRNTKVVPIASCIRFYIYIHIILYI